MINYITRQQLETEPVYKWDSRFIKLAEHVAQWSKGPRKRIGAVIVRPDKSVASMGYNGPPRAFNDEVFLKMSRDEQHGVVIHAEHNAIRQLSINDLFGKSGGLQSQLSMYVSPLFPCEDCARLIAAYGIPRVVAYCGHISPDWQESAKQAESIFDANNVECLFITD